MNAVAAKSKDIQRLELNHDLCICVELRITLSIVHVDASRQFPRQRKDQAINSPVVPVSSFTASSVDDSL